MLQNWFILLPEICILLFFPAAIIVEKYREEKTSKTFFSLSQFFLLATIFFLILFYNKSAFPNLWQNTPLRTMFKTFVCLLAWAWFYLSSKWFLNKNRTSFNFYSVCFAFLFSLNMMASSSSILVLGLSITATCISMYFLILRHWDVERVRKISRLYAFYTVVFCILMWGAIFVIYQQTGHFDYAGIKIFYSQHKNYSILTLSAVLTIIAVLMFLMAMVPFHQWFVAFISEGVLPVCGVITIIPSLIYICTLINLLRECFTPLINFLSPVLVGFAGLSLIVGSLSANLENNIRKLFAFVNIYSMGFTLIALNDFSDKSIIGAFAYLIVVILSFSGVYTVFLSMKSKGEYLSELSSINGFYQLRPYMSVALMVFMFSLIGMAPTLGFFGYLSVFNGLISTLSWNKIILLMLTLLFVAGACLQIIRTIYFEPLTNKYDRTDKAIYICLFINMGILLISLINPAWLMHDILIILGGI